ncbi:MAG: deoxyribodipyrimidine photo-lyase [Caulobacteraceae bacterium]
MAADPPVIVWFRRDLRLADNPALARAAAAGRPLICLYILDETAGVRREGAASRWWLDKSLTSLARDLETIGGHLVLRRGVSAAVLAALIAETGADSVFWNRLYDGGSVERDAAIKAALGATGVECRSFNAALLNEPWEVIGKSAGPYRVFSAYWRAARAVSSSAAPDAAPKRLVAAPRPRSETLASWNLHPRRPDWSQGFAGWTPGESGARQRLDAFLNDAANAYSSRRNRPDVEGTSRLSPHLHFGEIGPRQVWAAIHDAAAIGRVSEREGDTFLRELGWREFNHHLLFHRPDLAKNNLDARFDTFAWRRDDGGFEAWTRGRTGFAMVDAGMRQLWRTGWMHNRARMVAASFLVKDLMIDWRRGEAWFWDTLVDADIANNAANWQWVAGSGADAAPFFRVFNPTLQAEKFDPDGSYARDWIPELSGSSAGAYPPPIVDHALARERALTAYRSLTT